MPFNPLNPANNTNITTAKIDNKTKIATIPPTPYGSINIPVKVENNPPLAVKLPASPCKESSAGTKVADAIEAKINRPIGPINATAITIPITLNKAVKFIIPFFANFMVIRRITNKLYKYG